MHGPIDSHALITENCASGDTNTIIGCAFKVFGVPGHTLDHIAFFAADSFAQPTLFCGDTLFAGGCGRLFEGTAEQMYKSLKTLASLPSDTLVYCAHEYTQANLQFAASVEPSNQKLQNRIAEVAAARSKNLATVPSTLKAELETNPFLRSDVTEFKTTFLNSDNVRTYSDVDLFAEIRRRKDTF